MMLMPELLDRFDLLKLWRVSQRLNIVRHDRALRRSLKLRGPSSRRRNIQQLREGSHFAITASQVAFSRPNSSLLSALTAERIQKNISKNVTLSISTSSTNGCDFIASATDTATFEASSTGPGFIQET